MVDLIIQLMLDGITTGALYALFAVGFALIYSVTKVFHFAYGATFVLVGYGFYICHVLWGFPWIMAFIVALIISALFAICMVLFVYGPIQRHEGSFFTVFVASLGVAIIVENIISLIFSGDYISVSTSWTQMISLWDRYYVSPLMGAVILFVLAVVAALFCLLRFTNHGRALRALADDPGLTAVYGFRIQRLSILAFVLGSAVAAPGALILLYQSGLSPSTGHHIMLLSIIATFVGGIGSIVGAAAAGLIIGIVQTTAQLWLAPVWTEAIAFLIFFAFVFLRPKGLAGKRY